MKPMKPLSVLSFATSLVLVGALASAADEKKEETPIKKTETTESVRIMAPGEGEVPPGTTPDSTSSEMTSTRTTTEQVTVDDKDKSERFGFFLEPGLTQERSDSNIGADTNATGASLRVGAHFGDMFFAGIDGRYAQGDSTLDTSVRSRSYNAGVLLGGQTPIAGVRLWGVLIPWAESHPDEAQGSQIAYTEGTGYRVGLGGYVSVVSVNLEFQRINYNKATVEKGVGNTAKLEGDSYLLGLSFPITF